MKFKKLLATWSTLAVATLILSACGSHKAQQSSNKPATKQVLNWSVPNELATLDSITVAESGSADMINNSMEGLFVLKNNKATAGLAIDTKASADGLTYTFSLRKGAKWSNGDPVTAHDFVFAWRRSVDPKTNSLAAYMYSGIKNADDILSGKKAAETLGVKALSDTKLVVTLDKQLLYLKLLLADARFFPQNQRAVAKFGKKYGTSSDTTVFNGPFVLKNWTGSNLSWKLVKNNNYWNKKHIKMETINFKVDKSFTTAYNLYQANKVDFTHLSAEQAKQLADQPGYRVLRRAQITYMKFNETKKEFQNKKIRQAIGYAIDRKQMASSVAGGGSVPLTNLVPQGVSTFKGKDFATWAKTKVGVSYDPKLAHKLLKEGLKELGEDHFEFTLLGRDTEISKKETEFIQSQIEQTLPEVKVQTSNIPIKMQIAKAAKGDFDVTLTGWLADVADPSNFLDIMTKNNPNNMGKYASPKFNELMTVAETSDAMDKDKRFSDLIAAAKLLNEDQPVVPLIQDGTPEMLRPSVHGMIQNTAGLTENFRSVYITE